MKGIGSRLQDRVDRSARMPATRSILCARGESKLLQRVRKRQRHARAIEYVVVHGAVQSVLNAEVQTAGDGDLDSGRRHVRSGIRITRKGGGLNRRSG